MPPGTGLRAVLDRACAARGIRPSVAIQATAADAIADLTARGLGVGILSSSMAARHHDRLHALPICDLNIPALLAVIWLPTAGAAARELANRCRTAFQIDDPAASPRPARGRGPGP